MSLPPVHPALIHLSVAFLLLSFGADVGAKLARRPGLARVGFWTLFLATITAAVGIAAGYSDTRRLAVGAEAGTLIDLHARLGWILASLLGLLAIWRWRIRQQARRVVTRPYVLAAFIALALTAFQTWYGAELVFSHGIGVAAAGQGIESADQARGRLTRVRQALAPLETAVGGVGQRSDTEQGRESP